MEVVVTANERSALVEKIGEAGEAAELLAALDEYCPCPTTGSPVGKR